VILFKSKNNGVLLLLLCEDIVNPNQGWKNWIIFVLDNLLLIKIKGQTWAKNEKNKKYQSQSEVGFKDQNQFFLFFVVLRNLK